MATVLDPDDGNLLRLALGVSGMARGWLGILEHPLQPWIRASSERMGASRYEAMKLLEGLAADELRMVVDLHQDGGDPPAPALVPQARSYVLVAIGDAQGRVVGALCLFDRQPLALDPQQRLFLQQLAQQAGALVRLRHRASTLARQLEEQAALARQQQDYRHLLELRNEQLLMQMRLDTLTGLPNRQTFEEALDHAVQQAVRSQQPLALAVADIDHFKAINDTHGHPAGDAALVQVAQVLQRAAAGSVLAARQGGEEFVLLMPGHDPHQAIACCHAFRQQLREADLPFPVTLSIGVADWTPGESPGQLFARADAALYAAKRSGRDRVVPASLL